LVTVGLPVFSHSVHVIDRYKGKGYPDLITRQFLHTVHQHKPRLPIFGLFDFDCDGIAILRNYQNGSLQLAHEEGCTVPGMIWVGLKSNDIFRLPTQMIPEQLSQSDRFQDSERGPNQRSADDKSPADAPSVDGNLALTTRDRRMAVKLLAQICAEAGPNEEDAEQKQELQRMLMLNFKAEMQAVDNLGNIAHWLDERLCASLQPSA
jgi:meiotic recombination protein SPO11